MNSDTEAILGKIEPPDVRIFIDKIYCKDHTVLPLTDNQITVFVGPNNVGKSTILKEIHSFIKSHKSKTKLVRSISTKKIGSLEDFAVYLKKNLTPDEEKEDTYRLPSGGVFNFNDINLWWSTNTEYTNLSDMFCSLLSTKGRLDVSSAPDNISILDKKLTHPIHYLQKFDSFEKEFNSYFKQAFGLDLIVNRGAGSIVPLHVGIAPPILSGEDRISEGYIERLNQLPRLDDQGDGIRSFVGVLLSAFVSKHPILLIDEPEAFLHPPQAYLLGQMLAHNIPSNKQIFISTHSEDLLKGLADKRTDRVKIVRIQRDGNHNRFSQIDSEDIKQLWGDPLLRYSNILSGLFHSKVIVCESDGDCKFFGAMIDSITDNSSNLKPDLLFVHCGGKQRIPTVVNSLKRLGVKVIVVADFDLLSAKTPLLEIFVGLGGYWPQIESEWKQVIQAIDTKKTELNPIAVKAMIDSILSDLPNDTFPSAKAEEIRKVLKKTNPWSEAKSIGKGYIPAGGPTRMLTQVLDTCRFHGLNILEVGELECFDKSIGDHGPKWVNQVLGKDLKNAPDLEDARKFARQLLEQ